MNIKLTKKAEEELLKLVAGEISKINFTEMAVGDGLYTAEESTADITALKSERIKTKLGNIYEEIVGGSCQLFITSTFFNKDVEEKFEVREVGIYAKDNATDTEYLYAYYIVIKDDMAIAIVQDKTTPQYIPISVNSKLSNIDEANITLVDDMLVVNQVEFRKYKEEVENTFGGVFEQIGGLLPHFSDNNNPHKVTKAQVGLSNVDNTTDINKPISTAMQNALDLKMPMPKANTPKTLIIDINGYTNLDRILDRGWYYMEIAGGAGGNGQQGVGTYGGAGYVIFLIEGDVRGYFGSGAIGSNGISGGGGGSSSVLVGNVIYNCGGGLGFGGGGGGSCGSGGSGDGIGGSGGYKGISVRGQGGKSSTLFFDIFSIGGDGSIYGYGAAGGGEVGSSGSDNRSGGKSAINKISSSIGGAGGTLASGGSTVLHGTCSNNLIPLLANSGQGYIRLYKYNI